MRVMYVAPRFHTNQAPIVKNLLSLGHEVLFLVQRKEFSEDKSAIEPIVCKPNCIYKLIEDTKCNAKSSVWREDFRLRYFVPSIRGVYNVIHLFKPDVIIYREPTMFSLVARIIAILLGVPNLILYTQSPCVLQEMSVKRKILNFVRRVLFGTKIYSPVYVSSLDEGVDTFFEQGVLFIPFIMEFDDFVLNREYIPNGKIRLVDIGKYRDYKDHFVLVKALSLLPSDVKKEFDVTIVGQCVKDEEIEYYNLLLKFIRNKGLDDVIKLKSNIPFQDIDKVYLNNDVFILTSKRELASVAVLEAMKYGLVCISTNKNGTASYVDKKNGYIFKAEDEVSLCNILLDLFYKKNQLPQMGIHTYQYAKNEFSPNSYINKLLTMIK